MTEIPITPLPPQIDCETVATLKALSKASRLLGELKGEVSKIPNSGILIDTLALQEAKDSNEIENIVTTDDELYKASVDNKKASREAKEAINYAHALRLGVDKLNTRGLITVNDIIEIQAIIAPNHPIRKLPGTTLKNKNSGEIVFTPPQNIREIKDLFSNLEVYINDASFHDIDPLIKMPIIHFQFESIHPFYDGNGRTGRLLNMLFLVQQNLLDIPVLYLSSYIIRNKADYYRLLQEVRTNNNWEEWIVWMLKGVEITARETIIVVNKIKKLMDKYKILIRNNFSFYSHDLINILFKHPYTKIDFLENQLGVHRNTSGSYLKQLNEAKIIEKVKIGRSNYYINIELLNILKNR